MSTRKVSIYYLRVVSETDSENKSGHPVGCVAFVRMKNKQVARGIAICPKKENFNKEYYRNLAYTRLYNILDGSKTKQTIYLKKDNKELLKELMESEKKKDIREKRCKKTDSVKELSLSIHNAPITDFEKNIKSIYTTICKTNFKKADDKMSKEFISHPKKFEKLWDSLSPIRNDVENKIKKNNFLVIIKAQKEV